MTDSPSLCAQEVRKNDHDQFLCSLFVPENARQAFWALSLFQIETLRIRDAVSEPHLGLIRLQYWKDAIEAKYKGIQSTQEMGTHREFFESIDLSKIQLKSFQRYLNARSFDMEDLPHDDIDAWIAYHRATLGNIASMKCQAIGSHDHDTLDAAKLIGASLGLILGVRTIAFQARSGRVRIPRSLTTKHQIDLKALQNLTFSDELGAICNEICSKAIELLTLARQKQIDKTCLGVFLITISIEDYIQRIERRKFNPFDPNIGSGQLKRQLKMAYRAALKRF